MQIELDDISKSWGKVKAVDRVSCTADASELLVMLGPSGCGKSTILRLIAGLETLSGGAIRIGGRDVTQLPPAKRNISMVFQSYALFPHLNVEENIVFGLKVRRLDPAERKRRMGRVAELLGLGELLHRKPAELSGGQRQRVALGRAIVSEAPVCLMDEPLSNLDAKLRHEMRREIRSLQQRLGITMIYVTHDQKEALTMADQIAVMSMGRVEQIGTPQTIYHSPANIFVATFIGEANLIPGELIEIGDRHGTIRTSLGVFKGRLTNEKMQSGDAVCCLVRPEKLSLSGAGENRVDVTVDNILFLGESEQYLLQAANIHLKALAISAPAGIRKGEQAQVSFMAADALLLPAAGGGNA